MKKNLRKRAINWAIKNDSIHVGRGHIIVKAWLAGYAAGKRPDRKKSKFCPYCAQLNDGHVHKFCEDCKRITDHCECVYYDFNRASDVLGLVGKKLNELDWASWSYEDRVRAVDWALWSHLSASDNDYAEAPSMPDYVRVLQTIKFEGII